MIIEIPPQALWMFSGFVLGVLAGLFAWFVRYLNKATN